MGILLVLAGIVGVAGLVVAVMFGMYFNLWLQAKASGVPISILDMAMMQLRRVSPAFIVGSMIPMVKAGLDVNLGDVEAHVLAGGNLSAVTNALIRADKADLGMNFQQLAAIDLAGRDIADAVETHVSPKVLACPPLGRGADFISGVCQDGIRLSVQTRVTVRTRLDRLVGGAGEETIIARVGEGIVAAVGRATSHKEILESPDRVSEYLLSRGLDSSTCFEIISVDIADVSVLDNIGARLQSEQAGADKQIAQARAEVRRAAAVASRTEMEARTRQMEGQVESARAVVPRAAAAAFNESNLGGKRPLAPTCDHRLRWRTARV